MTYTCQWAGHSEELIRVKGHFRIFSDPLKKNSKSDTKYFSKVLSNYITTLGILE